MATGNLWRRGAALSQPHGRLSFRELRHSLVSLFRRANRARMRAADFGSCPQYSIAGRQRLKEGTMRGIRALVLAASIAAVLPSVDASAQAQSNYPARPIHLIVPCPAGCIVGLGPRALPAQVGRDSKPTPSVASI